MTAEDVAVIDTDVASALYRHRYLGCPLAAALSAATERYRPLISVVTLGETRYGAARRNGAPNVPTSCSPSTTAPSPCW